jgi:hypothetical protein
MSVAEIGLLKLGIVELHFELSGHCLAPVRETAWDLC